MTGEKKKVLIACGMTVSHQNGMAVKLANTPHTAGGFPAKVTIYKCHYRRHWKALINCYVFLWSKILFVNSTTAKSVMAWMIRELANLCYMWSDWESWTCFGQPGNMKRRCGCFPNHIRGINFRKSKEQFQLREHMNEHVNGSNLKPW